MWVRRNIENNEVFKYLRNVYRNVKPDTKEHVFKFKKDGTKYKFVFDWFDGHVFGMELFEEVEISGKYFTVEPVNQLKFEWGF